MIMQPSMRHILIAWLGVSFALASCSSDSTDAPGQQLLEQVVTFTGNSSDRVNFQYQAADDSPVINLWAKGYLDEKQVSTGQRLLLRYRLAAGTDPNRGGEISFLSLRRILTDTVTSVPSPSASGSLYLYSIQRSGQYLDLMTRMPATDRRKITIEATEVNTPDSIADLYISATAGTTEQTDSAYDATTWASLWIGPVWQRPATRAIRVHLNNSNNPYRSTFTFKK